MQGPQPEGRADSSRVVELKSKECYRGRISIKDTDTVAVDVVARGGLNDLDHNSRLVAVGPQSDDKNSIADFESRFPSL
jgi:hypothetical protein